MYTEGFDQWAKLNKNFTGPFAELNKTAVEMLQKMYQQQIEMTSENIDNLSSQIKRMSDIKKPDEILSLQKECMNENISTAVNNMQKLIQMTMQNFDTFTKTCSSQTSKSNEQGKTVNKNGK